MKIALITDQHFGARNDSPIFHFHFQMFYKNTFFPYLKQHGITNVIDLGDTFDRRKYINFHSLQLCKQYWFDQYLNNNLNLTVIVGNHCTFFKNTNEVNSPDLLLKEYSNIKVAASPQEITIDGCKIMLMPWICTDNHDECMEAIENTDAQILFGHLELNGFEMYKGHANDHGYETKIFDKFDLVCSGHFHHKSTRGNINYLGAPYEMTWSDYDDPRGFHVFDTDTRELTFIENPNKIYHKIVYDDTDKTIEYVTTQDFSEYKGCIIKVIIKQKTNPHIFDLFIDALEKAGVADLQAVEDHLNLDLTMDEEILEEAEDTLSILNKFIEQIADKNNHNNLSRLIKELYDEALAVE